jgi:hypothetical protein
MPYLVKRSSRRGLVAQGLNSQLVRSKQTILFGDIRNILRSERLPIISSLSGVFKMRITNNINFQNMNKTENSQGFLDYLN